MIDVSAHHPSDLSSPQPRGGGRTGTGKAGLGLPRSEVRDGSSDGAGGCTPTAPSEGAVPAGRLNLLLSYAGWSSESWVDHLPQLLQPLGVHSIRAGSGREATTVIQCTQIHIAVVDLGLPLDEGALSDPQLDEGGSRLLELLGRLAEPPPVVAVKRGRTHRDDTRDIAAALRFGAFAVMDRPRTVQDLNLMLEVLRRCMARHYSDRWPT